ncbi:amidohydrolase domain-containing protein [Rhizoctonia solani AG-1 IA]|uniref:Amidohydrolase domain-containing protein n=1 Tax=Thanatephorus cucumeris (strain AG1-IA) TaxID=983506 RepID=L8WX01_THACA|nr:amidohydrolase domain-containing protein [Rhizoctonia solani AG-1 IA]
MMFGTDHPFFPPVPGVADTEAKWASVTENLAAIQAVPGWSEADKEGVRSGNAIKTFGLRAVKFRINEFCITTYSDGLLFVLIAYQASSASKSAAASAAKSIESADTEVARLPPLLLVTPVIGTSKREE